MRLRTDRRRHARAERALTEHAAGAERTDAWLSTELSRAIDALPEALRVVFVLRMIEGFSHEEIAGALQTTVGASKVRLHRALKRLQTDLDHLRQESR
jgi:RNA polymerase sigma-70 factor (ECF subfamily)